VIDRIAIFRGLSVCEVSARPSVNAPGEPAVLRRKEGPLEITADIHG
jgi:hypothetical protein